MPHLRRTRRPSSERLRRGRRRRRRPSSCAIHRAWTARGGSAAAARAWRTARPRRARCRCRRKSRSAARWPSAGRSRRQPCATRWAQGREATEGNRLSRGTQQPAQAHVRMARREAWQRRSGQASTHLIVDSAVGLSKKLRALPSCKIICERADAAAEAPAVSYAGARRCSRRRCERTARTESACSKGGAHGGGASRLVHFVLSPRPHSKACAVKLTAENGI